MMSNSLWLLSVFLFMLCCLCSGCGTTRWSDTSRTGTEQLLISNAIDKSISKIDFSPMGDKKIFVKSEAIDGMTDNKYITMAIRQQLAASGGILCEKVEDAEYIVEIRAGAVGTDRDDLLLFGIPAMSLPGIPGISSSTSTSIPEIALIKRTNQKGVAKIAVFAYNKATGRPVWASGNNQSESVGKNLWLAGSGPLTWGTIYTKKTYAGHDVPEFMSQNPNEPTFADRPVVFPEKMGDTPVKLPSVENIAERPSGNVK